MTNNQGDRLVRPLFAQGMVYEVPQGFLLLLIKPVLKGNKKKWVCSLLNHVLYVARCKDEVSGRDIRAVLSV